MNETQPTQRDNDQVLVALEGDAGNLEKLVTLARECGFRKLLSCTGERPAEGASREDRNPRDGGRPRIARLLGTYRLSDFGIAQRMRDRAIPA